MEKIRASNKKHRASKKGRETKAKWSQVDNHKTRQAHLNATWDWSVAQWEELKKSWGHRCAYCGNQPSLLEHDHFIPMSHPLYSGTHPGNVLPCCQFCNLSKHKKHPVEWLSHSDYAFLVTWLHNRKWVSNECCKGNPTHKLAKRW